jgi:hypothetical protein
MLEAWETVATAGWRPALLQAPADWRRTYEPVFVLRPAAIDGDDGAGADDSGAGEAADVSAEKGL